MSRVVPSGTADALPTKEFFIYMLVKDIELIDSMLDLVDNSVDGARANSADQSLSDFFVKIEITPERFVISDNCGGISAEVAQRYAFRFGRPTDVQSPDHTIGLFGVGMKRALFKLGTKFSVVSVSSHTKFVIEVDVNEWGRTPEWTFPIRVEDLDKETPLVDRGTTITVEPLHRSVSQDFQRTSSERRLIDAIRQKHSESLRRGITITVNGHPVHQTRLELKQSDDLRPSYEALTLPDSGSPVEVDIYAGVTESDPTSAGWYVFCNDRLVLGADKSPVTGWGERDNQAIPRFHNQFAQFRGYVFLDSSDPANLPWTTTKTGLDENSPVYRAIRPKLTKQMRPIIDFLNQLDAEKDMGGGPLTTALKNAPVVALADITEERPFFVQPSRDVRPKMSRISYSRPKDQVDAAKALLGVQTNREVGQRTFDYFVQSEDIP